MATQAPTLAMSPLDGARRQGRLLRTDFRRSHGLILVVLMVLIGTYGAMLFGGGSPNDIVLWGERSVKVAWAFAMVGPIAGGWGAWLADRERRSGTETLLASVAMPTGASETRVLAVPVLAALLAYGVVAGVTLGRAAVDSVWGGPVWPVILMGAVFTAGYALAGTALGMLWPRRLTPFIAAFGLLMFTIVSYTYIDGSHDLRYLAPFRWVSEPNGYDQILYRANGALWSGIAVPVALTMGGVALVALTLMLARSRRRGAVVAGIIAALILVPSVNAAIEHPHWLIPGTEPGRNVRWEFEPVRNPPLTCTGEVVQMCVHVIHRNKIDEIGRITDAVVAPLAGLSGTDLRIEQRADLPSTDDIVRFNDDWLWGNDDFAVANVVVNALIPSPGGDEIAENDLYGPRTPVQAMISLWLAEQAEVPWYAAPHFTTVPMPEGMTTQADYDVYWADTGAVQNEVNDAAERFGALPEDVRSAWLAENWDAVRAGELTLEDLP